MIFLSLKLIFCAYSYQRQGFFVSFPVFYCLKKSGTPWVFPRWTRLSNLRRAQLQRNHFEAGKGGIGSGCLGGTQQEGDWDAGIPGLDVVETIISHPPVITTNGWYGYHENMWGLLLFELVVYYGINVKPGLRNTKRLFSWGVPFKYQTITIWEYPLSMTW